MENSEDFMSQDETVPSVSDNGGTDSNQLSLFPDEDAVPLSESAVFSEDAAGASDAPVNEPETEGEPLQSQFDFSDEAFDDENDGDRGADDSFYEEKEDKSAQGKKPKGERGIDFIFDILELFIFSLATVLLLTTFVFRHSVVDGGSMESTLFHGEHLIISDLFYTPERGDVIVCEDYSTELRRPIVKRIIALPGECIKMDAEGNVYINGEKLDEPYVHIDGPFVKTPFEITVPEGEIFVMGDHRNESYDSREFGTVDIDSILGKVVLRFYPLDKFGTVD